MMVLTPRDTWVYELHHRELLATAARVRLIDEATPAAPRGAALDRAPAAARRVVGWLVAVILPSGANRPAAA